MALALVKNPDIVAAVTAAFPQLCAIGFAAETEQLEQYARGKLAAKGLTAIVANNVGRSDIGFNSDDNEVTVYTSERSLTFDKRGKGQLARDLIDHFAQLLAAR